MPVQKFLKSAREIESNIPKKKPLTVASHADEGEGNWLVSYADMMTLLCGFFVMMFSMATIDLPKYDKVRESISKQFGGNYVSSGNEMAQYFSQVIDQQGIKKDVIVESDSAGVAIAFKSTLFFDTLDAQIRPEGRQILEKLAENIRAQEKEKNKSYKIVVEGHTDSRPVLGGIYASNWELSGARASRVVRFFLEKSFQPKLLTAIGYADTYPVSLDEHTQNRRVVVRILEPEIQTIPFPKSVSNSMNPSVHSASEFGPFQRIDVQGPLPFSPSDSAPVDATRSTRLPANDSASSAH